MWWMFVVVAIVVPCIGSLVILSYYLVKVIEKAIKKNLQKPQARVRDATHLEPYPSPTPSSPAHCHQL